MKIIVFSIFLFYVVKCYRLSVFNHIIPSPLPNPINRGDNVNSSWLRQIASFIKLCTKKYKWYSLPYSRDLPKINANEIIKIVIFGFVYCVSFLCIFIKLPHCHFYLFSTKPLYINKGYIKKLGTHKILFVDNCSSLINRC